MRRSLFFALLLCACVEPRRPAEFTLKIASGGLLAPLEPRVHESFTVLVKSLVFEVMLEPKAAGGWRSNLFEQWFRVDGHHLRFQLKRDLRFSDGTVVEQRDVIHSIAACALSVRTSDAWIEVDSAPQTVDLEDVLSRCVLFKEQEDHSLGTGPFHLVQQGRDRLTLERNVPRTGHITRVEVLRYPNPREAFASVLRGETNALIMLDPGQRELLQGVPGLQILERPGIHALTAVFNTHRLTSADRRALASTLPVVEIARNFGGHCVPVVQPASRETVLPDGPPLSVVVANAFPGALRAALALRRGLGKRAGEVTEVTLPEAHRRFSTDDFDIQLDLFQVWPERTALSYWHTGSAVLSTYSNPAVDAALNRGDLLAARAALQEDPPALTLCQPARVAALDSRLKAPQLGLYDTFSSVAEWEVSP